MPEELVREFEEDDEDGELAPELDYEEERGKPMPSYNHGHIQLNIGAALRQRYRKTHSVVSETALKLGGKESRGTTPDVLVYPKRVVDFKRDVAKMTEPPLLTIEILSATQSQQALAEKCDELIASGVKACWLVQPAIQAVTVFVGAEKPKTVTAGTVSDGITGIELPIEEIFSVE